MDSLAFLQALHPKGPWVLTAIHVNRKGIETQSFGPSTKTAARKWIKKNEGKRNLYFSVNTPRTQVNKKTNREDIEAVSYLHVDLDGRAGEPLEEELVRIRTLLTEQCPVPPPTAIVYSGGGYQAFWKLAQPIPIAGNLAAAQEAARYNKQLEIVLGGDNCHNIDRIMRLPGTTNLPNAKKLERGRTPTIAEVHSYHAERIYALTDFTPAPPLQTTGTDANTIVVPTNVARLASVEELDRWKVPDRVKVVVVQGFDPDNPKEGDNSRSAWLFDCCCQLVRAGVPDEVIYSIVTDPDFAISASVLDKGSNSDRYATRQINRAKEEVEEPWLRKMNERHLVIGNMGGKCRVLEEVYDKPLKRTRLTKQAFQDFRNRYSNVYVQVGKRHMAVGQWWLANPGRRQFDYLVFSPERDIPNSYNLWQGFACQSLPGEQHEPFLLHMRNNICSGVKKYYEYLLGWIARTVQYPGRSGEIAVVLRGKSGVGKSFFAKQFGSLWGRHFMQVSDGKHLTGAFNAHLRDCVVLFGDEAFFAGDKKHEGTLKALITEEHMIVEAKGIDSELSQNFIHLIMASNSDWVVPSGPAERRFFILDVGDNHQQDHPYFGAITKAMANGGRENLLHYLLNYDISKYNVRKAPHTAALLEQKLHSLNPMQHWWRERLMAGTLLSSHAQFSNEILCKELQADYVQTCAQYGVTRRGSATTLGLFLNKVCPGQFPMRMRQSTGDRKNVYVFPDLDMLRTKWEELYGPGSVWPTGTVAPAPEPF